MYIYMFAPGPAPHTSFHFSGVAGSLRSLDLSYNSLEEIPFKTLGSLRKLNWLNMHR